MRKTSIYVMGLLCCFLLLSACTRAISKAVRAKVSEDVTLAMVREAPEAFKEKMVMWGGVIVKTKNQKGGALIEIVQKPTSSEGRPKKSDDSEGRFLALYNGYLDSAIYAEKREVTVAGRILGEKQMPLDDIIYTYPLLQVEEMHLWPPRVEVRTYHHGPYYRYPPYWDYPYGWYR